MFRKQMWVWCVSGAIIAASVIMAFRIQRPKEGLGATNFEVAPKTGAQDTPIVPRNWPVVVRFLGDLAEGGTKQNDGRLIPFVIADRLSLEAEATNAVEYRWTVNGEVLKDEKGLEWSRQKDRLYDVTTAGELTFSVQVRGADPAVTSHPKEVTLKTEPLFIESFEKALTQEDDRALTGEDYTVEVSMAEPLTADLDFYQFRYFVNDVPQKHPDDGKLWTTNSEFTYTFPKPGHYTFKVEVRRATEKQKEDERALAETVVVADAVLLSFDAYPDKIATLGRTVDLDVFPESVFGKSECRFGVKKVEEADFHWLPDDDGTIWGTAERAWLPTEPGNYLVRAEVRDAGKQQADDAREILYTITIGEF
jgi:hypothetical protein